MVDLNNSGDPLYGIYCKSSDIFLCDIFLCGLIQAQAARYRLSQNFITYKQTDFLKQIPILMFRLNYQKSASCF